MLRKPPLVTVASMVAARFRGKNTTMSPLPEASCDAPPRRTAPPPEGGSGLIHAVIDLPATGAHVHEILCMGDGDVAANGFQFGAATDLTRADMPATSAQRSVSGNVTHVDVSAGGKGSEITRDIQNLNMSALRIESRHRAPPRSVAKPRAADASRLDVSTLSVQAGGSANVRCGDVASPRIHLDAIAARHGDFKLHPELSIGRACGLRREHANDFYARVGGLSLEGVIFEKLLRGVATRVGFNMHGIADERRGTGLEWNDIYGSEINGQLQRQTIFGFEHAIADSGGMRRARVTGLRALDGGAFFCIGSRS